MIKPLEVKSRVLKVPLTAALLVRSVSTVVREVAALHLLHTRLALCAVEVRVSRTLLRRRGHGAVPEGHVVQSGDAVKHPEADLTEGDLERLGDATQLHGDEVPQRTLVVERLPDHRLVPLSVHPEVHVCSAHRETRVIVPGEEEGGWKVTRDT